MITTDNTFYYLLKKSIKHKDFNLLKEIIFNEISKTIIYQREQIVNILKNNNIKYNEDDCIIEAIFDNIDKIVNDIAILIFERNKIKEYTENDLKIMINILKGIEKKDYSIIKNKILTYKELLQKNFNIDNNIDNKQKIFSKKKIILLLGIISFVSVIMFIIYNKKKNNKNKENNNSSNDNNYINSI